MSGSALRRGSRPDGAGDWDPDPAPLGGSFDGVRFHVFKNSAADPALQAITARGDTYEIEGMFWYQGETDAGNSTSASSYEANLNKLVAAMRTDFSTPNMDFFIGRLRNGIPRTYLSTVRAAMESVAATDANAHLVDCDNLALNADNIHFSASGQVGLGIRFANAFLGILPPDPDPEVIEALSSFDDVAAQEDATGLIFDLYVPDSNGASNGPNLDNPGQFTGFFDGLNGQPGVGLLADGSAGKVVFVDYSGSAITSDIGGGDFDFVGGGFPAAWDDSGTTITFTFVNSADKNEKISVSRMAFELSAVGGDNVCASFLDVNGVLLWRSGILSDGRYGFRSLDDAVANEQNRIHQFVLGSDTLELWTTGHLGNTTTIDFAFSQLPDPEPIPSGVINSAWTLY